MKKVFLNGVMSVVLMAGSVTVHAQDGMGGTDSVMSNFFRLIYNNTLLIFSVMVVLGVLGAGYRVVMTLIDNQRVHVPGYSGSDTSVTADSHLSVWERFNKRMWGSVPVEKEAEIDSGHEYDGIRELDNTMPPWWVYLFYATIIFSVGYLWYYSYGGGPTQLQEYQAAVEKAEIEKAQHLAAQGGSIDETNVTLLSDESAVAEGKEIYDTNCAVCHGKQGEGLVGPNLTDKYWLHGGSINNVFSVIKYGVPDKGMISWKDQLRPAAIQKTASYILTLQGTNPPNPKEAQGELYEPAEAPAETPAEGGSGEG